MGTGMRILDAGYVSTDRIGTPIVGLALVVTGIVMMVTKEGRRARIGGALLLLWGVTLFFPG